MRSCNDRFARLTTHLRKTCATDFPSVYTTFLRDIGHFHKDPTSSPAHLFAIRGMRKRFFLNCSWDYQCVKIRSTFSSYLEILRGFPQGSILGPILFNLFINDLMFFIQETEVCNFADDTTIYSCSPKGNSEII